MSEPVIRIYLSKAGVLKVDVLASSGEERRRAFSFLIEKMEAIRQLDAITTTDSSGLAVLGRRGED